MNMKRKKIVYLTIFIALFFITVGATTFAYFASNSDFTNASFNVATTTANTATFSAYTNGNIEFEIMASQMTQVNVSENFIATDNASGVAKIEAGDSHYTTTCTYDLIWVWDSEDRYMMSDVDLPYTYNEGIIYPYEFSVQVDDEIEKDLSALDWNEEGKAIIAHRELLAQKGAEVEDRFNIQVKMYNIPVIQDKLFNKKFKAHITIDNNVCTTVEANVKLRYYIYNTATGKYEETSSVPQGDYRLNQERTTCKKGGSVKSYDNLTGTIELDVGNVDECDVYFSILEKVKASGTDVTSSFDGNLKYVTVDVEDQDNYEIYYSTTEELTPATYKKGSKTNPGISKLGTTRVYWCATAEDCAPYCASNTVTIGQGIMTGKGKDYTGVYDQKSHGIDVNITNPSNATIYYSSGIELNKNNYKEKGSTINPTRSSAGTTIIYWCAESEGYDVLCANNKITITPATMSIASSNYRAVHDGSGHSINVEVLTPPTAKIYYSLDTQLNKNNYTSGTLNNPLISSIGTTKVYWCAVDSNYNTVCSSNDVINETEIINYIKSSYTKDGDNGIYYHDGTGSYTNASLEASDNSYRFAGANPNNYVCFENDDCTNEENLFQIIGLFPVNKANLASGFRTKLIKYTPSLTQKPWDLKANGTFSKNYQTSSIYKYLNSLEDDSNNEYNYYSGSCTGSGTCTGVSATKVKSYLSNMGAKTSLVDTVTWYVGGVNYNTHRTSNVKNFYNYEMNTTTKEDAVSPMSVNAKIGLMYVSDYAYAASPIYWQNVLWSNSIDDYKKSSGSNWLWKDTAWTITRYDSTSSMNAFFIHPDHSSDVYRIYSNYNIYPCFYLVSSAKYVKGEGSKNNPIIIKS